MVSTGADLSARISTMLAYTSRQFAGPAPLLSAVSPPSSSSCILSLFRGFVEVVLDFEGGVERRILLR